MNIEHEILRFDIRPESGLIINSRNVFRWYEDAAREVRPLCGSAPLPVYDEKRPALFVEQFGEVVSDISRRLYLKFSYFPSTYFYALVACVVKDVITNNGEHTVPVSNLTYFATPKKLVLEGLINWFFDFSETEPFFLLGRDFYAALLVRSGDSYNIKVVPRITALDSSFNLFEVN